MPKGGRSQGPGLLLVVVGTEAVVREVSTRAARLALAATLPSPVRLPVQVAIRAIERAIDLDLGR